MVSWNKIGSHDSIWRGPPGKQKSLRLVEGVWGSVIILTPKTPPDTTYCNPASLSVSKATIRSGLLTQKASSEQLSLQVGGYLNEKLLLESLKVSQLAVGSGVWVGLDVTSSDFSSSRGRRVAVCFNTWYW